MLDQFMEEVVTRRNRTMENVLMAVANISMVLSGILAMFLIQSLMVVISTQGFGAETMFYILLTLFSLARQCCCFCLRTGSARSMSTPLPTV